MQQLLRRLHAIRTETGGHRFGALPFPRQQQPAAGILQRLVPIGIPRGAGSEPSPEAAQRVRQDLGIRCALRTEVGVIVWQEKIGQQPGWPGRRVETPVPRPTRATLPLGIALEQFNVRCVEGAKTDPGVRGGDRQGSARNHSGGKAGTRTKGSILAVRKAGAEAIHCATSRNGVKCFAING